MGHQDDGVLLQEGGHGLDRRPLGDQLQGQEAVAADGQFNRAGGQQGGDVGARGAGQDLDVEAAPLIGPDGDRLVEAAVQGARRAARRHAQPHPARLVRRRGRAAAAGQAQERSRQGGQADGAGHQAATGGTGACHHA
ncbi:hypothetical protein D3C77_334000 [compost metagenome]